MDDSDARHLLIDAGIPEDKIGPDAINLASMVGDGLAYAITKKLIARLIEMEWPAMLREFDACRDRYRQLGITVE